jgi:hypothetical protein
MHAQQQRRTLHATVRVWTPSPQSFEQALQPAGIQVVTTQAGFVQVCEVAGLVPVHCQSSEFCPAEVRHTTSRVCWPVPHGTGQSLQANETQS